MVEKKFRVSWGEGYPPSVPRVVGIEFFSDNNGYGDEEIEKINVLGVGRSLDLNESGEHKVIRIK